MDMAGLEIGAGIFSQTDGIFDITIARATGEMELSSEPRLRSGLARAAGAIFFFEELPRMFDFVAR